MNVDIKRDIEVLLELRRMVVAQEKYFARRGCYASNTVELSEWECDSTKVMKVSRGGWWGAARGESGTHYAVFVGVMTPVGLLPGIPFKIPEN